MEKTFGFAIRVGTTVLAGENIRKTVNDATGTARTGQGTGGRRGRTANLGGLSRTRIRVGEEVTSRRRRRRGCICCRRERQHGDGSHDRRTEALGKFGALLIVASQMAERSGARHLDLNRNGSRERIRDEGITNYNSNQ